MARLSESGLKRSPPPTPEERERALAALADLRRLHQELLAARGGKFFPSSVEVLRELRGEMGEDTP